MQRPTLPSSSKIEQLQVNDLQVEIRRSAKRKKSIALKIEHTGEVVVLAPMRTTNTVIRDLLKRKATWIALKRESATQIKPHEYIDDECFYLLGSPLTLRVIASGKPQVSQRDDTLQLHVKADADQHTKHRQLQQWYRHQAQPVLNECVNQQASRLSLQPAGVQIKSYRARWGSCTASGVIQLNWRLIMAPIEVIDYVVIHELCHLQHFNHSPVFWAEVAQACPAYQAQKRWLKQHGELLRLD